MCQPSNRLESIQTWRHGNEDNIRNLQAQIQLRDRQLAFTEGQLLTKNSLKSPVEDDSERALSTKESHISTGRNTGLRKEADFPRQRLASGSLSSEDCAKAINIINLIEGRPSEESLNTQVGKGGAMKSTTSNVSSYDHNNGTANLAMDLKMHDLTKSITKMKAFDKFQRMQQDSDRLGQIARKLAESKNGRREKPKESDRVTSFQKRTAREVEKLNQRLDKLLSRDNTDSKNTGDVSKEIQTIRSLVDKLNERFDDSVDLWRQGRH